MGKVIINGEVVDSSDPRVRQRTTVTSGASQQQKTPQQSSNSGGRDPVYTTAGGGGYTAFNPRGQRAPQPAPPQPAAPPAGGPLDALAQQLGIAGRFVTTPAIGFMGWRPVQLPLVWLVAFGLVFTLLRFARPGTELRVAAGGLIALGVYIHMQSNAGPLPAAAAGAGPAVGGGGGGGDRGGSGRPGDNLNAPGRR